MFDTCNSYKWYFKIIKIIDLINFIFSRQSNFRYNDSTLLALSFLQDVSNYHSLRLPLGNLTRCMYVKVPFC